MCKKPLNKNPTATKNELLGMKQLFNIFNSSSNMNKIHGERRLKTGSTKKNMHIHQLQIKRLLMHAVREQKQMMRNGKEEVSCTIQNVIASYTFRQKEIVHLANLKLPALIISPAPFQLPLRCAALWDTIIGPRI